MPHLIERASTGRATCRGCASRIAAGELRLGERVPNPFGDDGTETTHWFHVVCGAYRRPEAFLEALATTDASIDGRHQLEHEARAGVTHHRLPRLSAAQRASTGRATCRACREPIAKDTWRIALVFYEDGRFNASGFVHISCAPTYFETPDLMPRLRHFSPALSDDEIREIGDLLAPPPSP